MSTAFDMNVATGQTPLLGGKIAVVTGAASGIGRQAFEMFRAAGATVAGCDINEAALEELGATAPDCLLRAVDVTDSRQVHRFAEEVVEAHGHVDVLFNSAGVGTLADSPLATHETPDDIWSRTLDINLTGTFNTSKAILPAMLERGGSVINIASILALVGQAGAVSYHASKGGVLAMTRGMAMDYAEQGVRVNVLAPGYCDTEMVQDYTSKLDDQASALADLAAAHPLGRIGKPEEVAALALWLASDAATFVTGACFSVDGGFVTP